MTQNSDASRAAVVVERQLWQQMALVERLEAVNDQMATMLGQPGSGSMTDQDIQRLQSLWQEAATMMESIQSRQDRVSKAIEQFAESDISLGTFLQRLEATRRAPLEALRTKLMTRLQAAFGRLIGNQATLVYLFEFHRNFIGSLVQHDFTDNQYSESGRSKLMASGTLLHRAV